MFFFRPKSPVTDDHRDWLEDSMLWLHQKVPSPPICDRPTVLPNSDFFPDKWEPTERGGRRLLRRVMSYMPVEPHQVKLEIYSEGSTDIYKGLPEYSMSRSGSAGHMHPKKRGGKFHIGLEEEALKNPLTLVATLAHELSHVILLGGKIMRSSAPDHEHMTDLLTVFLGFGVFSANSAVQHHSHRYGWSVSTQGYLSEPMYGYALALYAHMRGETKPDWVAHLDRSVRGYFKSSQKFISKSDACKVSVVC